MTTIPQTDHGARRCLSCGGLNAAEADWCGQCHTRFDASPRSAPNQPDLQRPPSPAPSGLEFDPLTVPVLPQIATTSPSLLRADTPAEPPLRSAFRVVGDVVWWTCSVCGHVNGLDARACQTCGASFGDAVAGSERPRPERDPNAAALYSLLLPGAGHAYLGYVGQAIARAVMSIWVVGVALIAVFAGGGGPSALISASYGIAAVGLWLAAAHDAFREANEQPGLVWLSGRRFLYVTLGLIAVLFMVITLGAIGARGTAGS